MSNKFQRNKQRANAKELRKYSIKFLLDVLMNSRYFKEWMHKNVHEQTMKESSFLSMLKNPQDRFIKGFSVLYPNNKPTMITSTMMLDTGGKYIKKGDQK